MGSSAILIGAIALGTALICLFAGFRWGRSNVRSQIEDALDMARVSADAREFALREQLDQKMLEVSELRARAEEVQALQDEVARLRSSPGIQTQIDLPENEIEIIPEDPPILESVAAVADPIQRFFHREEQKPQSLNAAHDIAAQPKRAPFPNSFSSTFSARPAASPAPLAPEPAESAEPPAVQPARPAAARPSEPPTVQPAKPVAAKPVRAVNNDDWDEFAKSLEVLKSLQK